MKSSNTASQWTIETCQSFYIFTSIQIYQALHTGHNKTKFWPSFLNAGSIVMSVDSTARVLLLLPNMHWSWGFTITLKSLPWELKASLKINPYYQKTIFLHLKSIVIQVETAYVHKIWKHHIFSYTFNVILRGYG